MEVTTDQKGGGWVSYWDCSVGVSHTNLYSYHGSLAKTYFVVSSSFFHCHILILIYIYTLTISWDPPKRGGLDLFLKQGFGIFKPLVTWDPMIHIGYIYQLYVEPPYIDHCTKWAVLKSSLTTSHFRFAENSWNLESLWRKIHENNAFLGEHFSPFISFVETAGCSDIDF